MSKLLRRTFLAGAGLGLSAVALRRQLGLRPAHAAATGGACNLILLVAQGGWDVTYALDAKPGLSTIDAPAGDVQDIGGLPIFVHDSRPAVTDFFTAYASQCALVRGVSVRSVSHTACTTRMLTGTPSETNADAGAIVASQLGLERPIPYLVLGRTSFTGPHAAIATRTGTTNQLHALLDPNSVLWFATTPPQDWQPGPSEETYMREYVTHRANRELALRGEQVDTKGKLEDFLSSLERGEALKNNDLGTFNFNRELGPQTEVAVAALEQGLCRAVQMEFGDFDTHVANSEQAALHETFFAGLHTLMDELAGRPGTGGGSLLDETVVAVVSEMGRTPKLNSENGKDHWPVTSALVLGAGVAGGQVLGGTSDDLDALPTDLNSGATKSDGAPIGYDNFVAGVLELAGVDASAHLEAEPLHALRA